MNNQFTPEEMPAFPVEFTNRSDKPVEMGGGRMIQPNASIQFSGVTVLLWLAGQALQGLTSRPDFDATRSANSVASDAMNYAEALLVEWSKRRTEAHKKAAAEPQS